MGRNCTSVISYTTTEDELRDLFSQAGAVDTVNVVRDNATGRARGSRSSKWRLTQTRRRPSSSSTNSRWAAAIWRSTKRVRSPSSGAAVAATAAALVAAAIVVANRAGKTR